MRAVGDGRLPIVAITVLFCGLAALLVWHDVRELFVWWYSGSEPPVSRYQRWLFGLRVAFVSVAAVLVAVTW